VFLTKGERVIGLDNFITGRRENVAAAEARENFELVEVDLNQQDKLVAVLEQVQQDYGRIDLVAHLASPASPPLYQKYPVETYLVNSLATHNILAWLEANQPKARFLFASTSEVYGNPLVHPQPESYWGNVNPNGARSCYDESKRLGETIGGIFEREHGMDVRMMRIFNTYGPRMDLDDGRVLPQFVKQCLAGEKLTVYGDGSQTRSYCFVSDLVEGAYRLLTLEGLKGETVNLGNSGEFTILETAKIINELAGRAENEMEFLPLPEDDPMRRQPDISKAKKLLGWEPQVQFREGLKMMIDYYGKKKGS
jgi:nucleoside-diphosphate-sugar epimerase